MQEQQSPHQTPDAGSWTLDLPVSRTERNRLLFFIPKAIPPKYTSEGKEMGVLKRWLHTHTHCSIIHSNQDMEMTKMPTHLPKNFKNVILVQNEILHNIKEVENPAACDNMNETEGYHINKTGRAEAYLGA